MDRGACPGRKELDTAGRLNRHHNVNVFPNDRKEQSELNPKSNASHICCAVASVPQGEAPDNKIYRKQTHKRASNITGKAREWTFKFRKRIPFIVNDLAQNNSGETATNKGH